MMGTGWLFLTPVQEMQIIPRVTMNRCFFIFNGSILMKYYLKDD